MAEVTKVTTSLFEALERGDVSRWPKGIYKRSFFRGYVAAIGLPTDSTTEEFLQLFPDEKPPEMAVRAAADQTVAPSVPLRLTLEPGAGRVPLHRHVSRAAVIDAATILVIALGLAWWSGLDTRTTMAFAALTFYPQLALIVRKGSASWKAARATARPAAGECSPEPAGATVSAT